MAEPLYDPSTEVLSRGRDGTLRAVPKDQVDQVAASGGHVLDDAETAEAARNVARHEEATSAAGQARTFFTAGAAGVLSPFAAMAGGTGEQAIAGIVGDDGNGEQMMRMVDQMRYDAEANPTAQFLGSTVGTTAVSALGGSGVGMAGGKLATALGSEALAANLASGGVLSQLAGKAVTAAPTALATGAENFLGGIGAANEQAFLENRELASDEVLGAGLVGAGLGAGIGLGARGLGWGASKLGQKVARAVPKDLANTVAERAGWDAVIQGAPKVGAIKDVVDDAGARLIGRRALNEGIVETEQKLGAQAALDLTEQKLRDTGKVFDEVRQKAAEHVDSAWLLEKIETQVEKIKSRAGTTSAKGLGDTIEHELDPVIDRMRKGEINSFEDIQNARKQVRDEAQNYKGAKKKAFDELERSLTDTLDEAVQRADKAQGAGGKLFDDWKQANHSYRELSTIREAYEGKIAKAQMPKPLLSFGDQNIGQGAAVLGSLVTGNVGTGALLGLATGAARKVIREKGSGWIARAADHLAQGGEVPSVTKLLAASSQARQQLGKYAVSQMVQRGARKAVSAAEESPAGFAYGALANYSDPKQVSAHYADAAGYLERSQGDIEGMASRANQHLGALADEQPELAAAAQVKMARAIDYLRETQPVSPPQSVLAASFGNVSKSLPPTYQQVSWLKRFRATVDPSVIYGEIARGVVNPETVETLQTLYPAYYASVVEGTLSGIHENPEVAKNMTYSQRLALDNLMGGTGQVEPTRRFSVQDRLAQANAEVQQNTAAPPPSSRKTPEIAKLAVTTSDRLMTL